MTKRDYKTGGLRERSPGSWELKVRTVDPKTGRRVAKFFTYKGTRLGAKKRLGELLAFANDGNLPDEQMLFGSLLDRWEAGLDVSPKTAERYLELIRIHIRPHLGALRVRTLTTSRIEQLYGDLRNGVGPDGKPARPLAPRTIGHIHRRVSQALALAERDRLIPSNPARLAKRPKAPKPKIEILTEAQVRDMLEKLSVRNVPGARLLYTIATAALGTGMRRGEVLALRWQDVDLDAAVLQVEQSLEQTKAQGLRFKAPKTDHGRRSISLPAFVVGRLRNHWKAQLESRVAMGLGKAPADALVFPGPDFKPRKPNALTKEWATAAEAMGIKLTFHGLRHTHASQLIASGMDVLTISRRLGHGSPAITLNVYAHFFEPLDGRAAAVFDAAYGGSFGENNREPGGTK